MPANLRLGSSDTFSTFSLLARTKEVFILSDDMISGNATGADRPHLACEI
jgi:hypothetical protein